MNTTMPTIGVISGGGSVNPQTQMCKWSGGSRTYTIDLTKKYIAVLSQEDMAKCVTAIIDKGVMTKTQEINASAVTFTLSGTTLTMADNDGSFDAIHLVMEI